MSMCWRHGFLLIASDKTVKESWAFWMKLDSILMSGNIDRSKSTWNQVCLFSSRNNNTCLSSLYSFLLSILFLCCCSCCQSVCRVCFSHFLSFTSYSFAYRSWQLLIQYTMCLHYWGLPRHLVFHARLPLSVLPALNYFDHVNPCNPYLHHVHD